ncbi:hypothetical protein ACFOEE_10105 [Pseudoalteromonas fenneropenaei]|uniref:Uncharacterized protein n=1 Tax=Pseudoalteromonas fenneropenaei TaxID=1737459 RepID=A0ABV7CJY7_9GAMM
MTFLEIEVFMSSLPLLLRVANITLGLLMAAFVVTVVFSYPLAELLPLGTQVAAHIATILVAALIKISYVLRCVCQYQLGMEVR